MRLLIHLRNRRSISYSWLAVLTLIAGQSTFAADPVAKTDDFGRDLVVDPAAEPVPALRYRLLPPSESLQPGNAAPIYLRLEHERGQEWRKRLAEEPSEYLDMPFDEMPLEKVGKLLEFFQRELEQISAAGILWVAIWGLGFLLQKQVITNWQYIRVPMKDSDACTFIASAALMPVTV